MTTLTLPAFFNRPAKPAFDLPPLARGAIAIIGATMTALVLLALVRGLTGLAPSHPNIREFAIAIHVATVVPAIPLGTFLLLAPKGTKMHKSLGKLWVALMLTTATAAIFIQTSGTFSPIHIFVPLTFIASYKLVATARRGDMKGHKKEILSLYFGALMIPGIASMALPGRLMNVWLFW